MISNRGCGFESHRPRQINLLFPEQQDAARPPKSGTLGSNPSRGARLYNCIPWIYTIDSLKKVNVMDFSKLYILLGIIAGIAIGLALTVILFSMGIGITSAKWFMVLSFGIPVVIGFFWGLGKYKAS